MPAAALLVLPPLACASGVESNPGAFGGGGASPSSSPSSSTSTTTSAIASTGATTSASTGAAGTGGTGGAGGQGGAPSCPTPGAVVLAVDKLFLGDTNPDGSPNVVDGWRQYGFNVDGLVSDPSSTDLCQPYVGALKNKVYQDGNAGIDNSFGENILPTLLALNPNISQQVNAAIQSGQFTLLFKLDGLGASADYDPTVTKLYEAAPLAGFAAFDGTDCWPVQPGFLSNPMDIESSVVAFPTATLASNVWSSNGTATLTLPVLFGGLSLSLTVHEARLSMQLDASHQKATAGQLGGVLGREEFADAIRDLAAQLGLGCSDPTTEAILDQLRQAADVMKDGSQNPAATCDGISIGVGFTAKADGRGPIAPMPVPTPDPCP